MFAVFVLESTGNRKLLIREYFTAFSFTLKRGSLLSEGGGGGSRLRWPIRARQKLISSRQKLIPPRQKLIPPRQKLIPPRQKLISSRQKLIPPRQKLISLRQS